MFSSIIDSTIDAKGRLVIPQSFRDELGTDAVITYCNDHCLCIYPADAYEEIKTKILNAKKDRVRGVEQLVKLYIEASWEVKFDQSGRVTITQAMRDRMKFTENSGKTIKVVGSIDHIQLWTPEERDALLDSFSREDVANLKEYLGI